MLRISFGPLCIYTYSVVSVTAVVTSCEFVHKIPTVLGSLFNLERSRRLSVVAGAISLSRVMVVFSTVLLWSDISNSRHPHCSENQNNNLLDCLSQADKLQIG